MASARELATAEAKAIFETDFVVLDTETTGLDEKAEIVEIAILDKNGSVLMDTLVKPRNKIPSQASSIHGITNHDVKDAPTWADIYPKFREAIKNKTVVIYNSKYDNRIIKQTCSLYGLPNPRRKSECAMLLYAAYRNIRNNRTGSPKWHKLTEAMEQCGIPKSAAHRAKGDCEMALNLLRFMAQRYDGELLQPIFIKHESIKRKASSPKQNGKSESWLHHLLSVIVLVATLIIKMIFEILRAIYKKIN